MLQTLYEQIRGISDYKLGEQRLVCVACYHYPPLVRATVWNLSCIICDSSFYTYFCEAGALKVGSVRMVYIPESSSVQCWPRLQASGVLFDMLVSSLYDKGFEKTMERPLTWLDHREPPGV